MNKLEQIGMTYEEAAKAAAGVTYVPSAEWHTCPLCNLTGEITVKMGPKDGYGLVDRVCPWCLPNFHQLSIDCGIRQHDIGHEAAFGLNLRKGYVQPAKLTLFAMHREAVSRRSSLSLYYKGTEVAGFAKGSIISYGVQGSELTHKAVVESYGDGVIVVTPIPDDE